MTDSADVPFSSFLIAACAFDSADHQHLLFIFLELHFILPQFTFLLKVLLQVFNSIRTSSLLSFTGFSFFWICISFWGFAQTFYSLAPNLLSTCLLTLVFLVRVPACSFLSMSAAFSLSRILLGCLKGSWRRTSPQRVKAWSSVHFIELFLEKKNVNDLNLLLSFWAGIRTNPALIAYTLTVKSKLVLIKLTLALFWPALHAV